MRFAPPTLEDWRHFLEFQAPVQVQHADGSGVTHAPFGRPEPSDANLAQVMTLDEVDLVLYDELRAEVRRIPATKVLEVTDEPGPGLVVTVSDDVEPDPGDTVQTRG